MKIIKEFQNNNTLLEIHIKKLNSIFCSFLLLLFCYLLHNKYVHKEVSFLSSHFQGFCFHRFFKREKFYLTFPFICLKNTFLRIPLVINYFLLLLIYLLLQSSDCLNVWISFTFEKLFLSSKQLTQESDDICQEDRDGQGVNGPHHSSDFKQQYNLIIE